ncbi:MAG: PQQ-binding-like beta-propeller repeat protein [Pirellulaceae bacterium]
MTYGSFTDRFSMGLLSSLVVVFSWGLLARPTQAQTSGVGTASFGQLTDQDWPWWRGPNRNGVAEVDVQLPTRFGNEENVIWKTPLAGRGHSSPIVIGERIFLATADEADQKHSVLCFDFTSGEQLWAREISQGGFPKENHPKNTEASPTIACDGEKLFITFFHHKQVVLTALDLAGETIWEKVVGAFNPQLYKYGYAPSPVLYEDKVIVAAEYDGPSGIVAFSRKDGRVQWKAPRSPSITFSSPVIANVGGKDQLMLSGAQVVTSYDPKTGKGLWQVPGTTAATCGSMVWDGDVVFASGGYPKPETIAIRADGSRRVVWKNKQKCYEQSMIVVDGYLYGLTDRGVLYCWRCSDGKEMWRERLAGPVSASPVYAGGHIYWANEAGTVYVFTPNSQKFDLVAENRLGNEAFASPAVSQNRMLFRIAEGRGAARQEYLVCIGNR